VTINIHDAEGVRVIDVLPGVVVEKLALLTRHRKGLKIYAYHTFLIHFLLRLSIPAIHVPSQSLRAASPETSAVVLGGSAESLDKILHIIANLPVADVSVFIVQHILEESENHLDKLLKVRTDYEVIMPQHLMPINKGTIYIAPPGHHMKVSNGLIYLTRDQKVKLARPSIDVLFNSITREYGDHAIGALLCGYGEDGIEGIRALKNAGGVILLESPEECRDASILPTKARKSGQYENVLGLRALTCFLASAVAGRKREIDRHLINLFLEAVFDIYGYDFRGYQQGTIERRIDKLIGMLNLKNFFEFQREIFSDPSAFERFFVEISINVSSFFRHPKQFRLLREEILPYLDSFPFLKIWSAGCATGEEVYSLAFLLDEMGMLEKTQLFATDINRYVLDQAKTGLFPLNSLAESRENYLKAGGKRSFDSFIENEGLFIKVPERYCHRILFHHHSLAHDGVFNEFQLILCRNVLIYFDPPLHQKVMGRFAKSLHRDGCLVLGPNESLGSGDWGSYFATYTQNQHIYRVA
jgi:chemotaxis protein methyltransferase CheR